MKTVVGTLAATLSALLVAAVGVGEAIQMVAIAAAGLAPLVI